MATKLTQDRMKDAEFKRRVHRVSPEAVTTLEDVCAPDYWVHTASQLTVGDKIEVLPEGNAWYAELLVVSCSRLHAKVIVLSEHKLQAEVKKEESKDAPFKLEFKGPNRKWAVIRTKDKEIVKEGFDDKDSAAKWLADNQKDLTV